MKGGLRSGTPRRSSSVGQRNRGSPLASPVSYRVHPLRAESSSRAPERAPQLVAALAGMWNGLTDAKEFGEWFGVRFERPFLAGAPLRGVIVPTKVDLEVARLQEPSAGKSFDITVDRIEPQRLISLRWHPYAV